MSIAKRKQIKSITRKRKRNRTSIKRRKMNGGFSKREILILDCPEITTPLVLKYVFKEFAKAFEDNGHIVKEISSIGDINNNAIVLMGNTFKTQMPAQLLQKQAPDAIYIGWYWNGYDVTSLKYFLHIYENMLKPNNNVKELQKFKNSCPLLLRASEHPDKIGTYPRNESMVYCYMGFFYNQDWVPKKFKGLYHASDHTNFLPYDERRKNYLSSKIALGFQSQENIDTAHVSQRIYEGMAYGCVVITNSPPAVEQTEGIAVLATSKEDLEVKIQYYIDRPEEVIKKQEAGYSFVKKTGTNHYSMKIIIDKLRELYGNIL